MDKSLTDAYERNDSIRGDRSVTEYYMGNRVYDSLSDIAKSIMGSFQVIGDLKTFSLYRLNHCLLVNAKPHELETLCRGNPVIHVTREGSRVVSRVINASGDGDDLLKIQEMINGRMLSVSA